MQQKVFKEILERYLKNSCTPQEEALVEEWFEAIGKGERKEMSDEAEQQLFNLYNKDFQKIFRHSEARTFSLTSHRNLWIKLAATVLIILGPLLYIYLLQYNVITDYDLSDIKGSTLKKVINTQSSAYSILLSDGSEVVLNPGSILTFKYPFDNGVREVNLEGEAFFSVAQDPLLPFVVKTGQLMTRVLGTSFTVKANKGDEHIIVTVKTGKVLVQQASSEAGKYNEPAVLTPNQQAVCNIQRRTISRRKLEDQRIMIRPDSVQRHRFHEAPINEILRAVERSHRTRIIFDESNFRGCLLSTSISVNEDLFKRLDIICKAIGATYKVDGLSIIVSGKSCDKKNLNSKMDMNNSP